MPQKKNPETAELIRGKTGTVVGALMGLLTICKGLPMSYNRDLQEATPKIQTAVKTTRASIRIMTKIVDSLIVDKKRLFEQSTKGFTTATELADTIVRETDISFKTAHQIIGILAKEKSEPSLKVLDEISVGVLGFKLSEKGLTEEHIRVAIDPFENVAKRKVLGGPAPETVLAEIENKYFRIKLLNEEIKEINGDVEKALKNLTCLVGEKIDS